MEAKRRKEIDKIIASAMDGYAVKFTLNWKDFPNKEEIIEEAIKRVEAAFKPKERTFTETEISQLQSKVYEITGKGEVMKLFNELLGVSAG